MSKTYKIYMDVCCLNRPFDDWSQPRIHLEAEAIVTILERCQTGDWLLVGSTAIESEVAQTPEITRKQQVIDLLAMVKMSIRVTSEIMERASSLQNLGFKPFDALHIACAEAAHVDIFLTTDDRLLRKASTHINQLNVEIQNPLIWLITATTD
ncbi:type II toxin-antitoxin system VapC family toxin [Thermosynechococcus sp. FA-CM-4201]